MPGGSSKIKKVKTKVRVLRIQADKPRCGLCGKTRNLTKIVCCGNGLCAEEQN